LKQPWQQWYNSKQVDNVELADSNVPSTNNAAPATNRAAPTTNFAAPATNASPNTNAPMGVVARIIDLSE
jgi:hypothetical protein